MQDRTGEPRKVEEFQEALKVVEGLLIKFPLDQPMLVVHLPIIRDALNLAIVAAGRR